MNFFFYEWNIYEQDIRERIARDKTRGVKWRGNERRETGTNICITRRISSLDINRQHPAAAAAAAAATADVVI